MKKGLITISAALVFSISMNAQVGVGTVTPSDAAMLDVSSTSDGGLNYKGFMPPVVTIATRDLIPVVGADAGMMVYVSDAPNGVECLQVFNGTNWGCVNSSGTRSLVGFQNFEGAPTTPLAYTDSGTGTTITGVGSFPSSNYAASGTFGYSVNNGTSTLTFDPVDVSAYVRATLEFSLASFSNATGNGADGGDVVNVYISTDNGTTFSQELELRGNGNSKWDHSGTGIIEADYDSDNNETRHQTTAGGSGVIFTGLDAFSTVKIFGIPNATNVVVRIELINNTNNELWVIDDVSIYGE